MNLSASMMCADFSNLKKEVEALERAGIDSFHLDVMDGQFVDNFGLGFQDMHYIRSATKKPVEMHLMIRDPVKYLEILKDIRPDTIYIHPEADQDPSTTLEKVRKMRCAPGIAINPGTSIPQIEELLNICDKVLVLAVNPGHAGRTYLPHVGDKVQRLSKMRDDYNFEIMWDGAASYEIIKAHTQFVDGFVLGTASLFGHGIYKDNIQKIRRLYPLL